jgi:hypothetical protein
MAPSGLPRLWTWLALFIYVMNESSHVRGDVIEGALPRAQARRETMQTPPTALRFRGAGRSPRGAKLRA